MYLSLQFQANCTSKKRRLGVKLFIRDNGRAELTGLVRDILIFSRYKTRNGQRKHEVSELDGLTAQVITIGILEEWDLHHGFTNAIKSIEIHMVM